MNTSYDVKLWKIRVNRALDNPKRVLSHTVRWTVAGKEKSNTLRTAAQAENFLSDLRQAAKKGEEFDLTTGLPLSMLTPEPDSGPTFMEFAQSFMVRRWKGVAARTRETDAYALIVLALAYVDEDTPAKPQEADLRNVLRNHVLLPEARRRDLTDEQTSMLCWLEKASLPLADLEKPVVLRRGLNAIGLTVAGTKAKANTVKRKRETLHHLLELAVEEEVFTANPLNGVKWSPPKVAGEVDPRIVVNPKQARLLLSGASRVGRTRGARMKALYACIYYAALRVEEAAALGEANCHLPKKGWGLLTLEAARPQANTRYTDSGEAHDERGLKHRPEKETRQIPIPPELVIILRQHIEEYGVATDGRLFRTSKGKPYAASAISRVWQEIRNQAFTPEQIASPLAARPYDLRHAAVSLWLNAGVPVTEVAERAGQSVEVLQRIYAKCVEGQALQANRRITQALK